MSRRDEATDKWPPNDIRNDTEATPFDPATDDKKNDDVNHHNSSSFRAAARPPSHQQQQHLKEEKGEKQKQSWHSSYTNNTNNKSTTIHDDDEDEADKETFIGTKDQDVEGNTNEDEEEEVEEETKEEAPKEAEEEEENNDDGEDKEEQQQEEEKGSTTTATLSTSAPSSTTNSNTSFHSCISVDRHTVSGSIAVVDNRPHQPDPQADAEPQEDEPLFSPPLSWFFGGPEDEGDEDEQGVVSPNDNDDRGEEDASLGITGLNTQRISQTDQVLVLQHQPPKRKIQPTTAPTAPAKTCQQTAIVIITITAKPSSFPALQPSSLLTGSQQEEHFLPPLCIDLPSASSSAPLTSPKPTLNEEVSHHRERQAEDEIKEKNKSKAAPKSASKPDRERASDDDEAPEAKSKSHDDPEAGGVVYPNEQQRPSPAEINSSDNKITTRCLDDDDEDADFDVDCRNPRPMRKQEAKPAIQQQKTQHNNAKYQKQSSSPQSTTIRFYNGYRFQEICALGEGTFGRVSLVRDVLTGNFFALKKIDKKKFEQELGHRAQDYVLRERDAMVKLSASNCPYLAHLHGTFQTVKSLYYVLDYYPGQTLMHFLESHRRPIPLTTARIWFAQLVVAICTMHRQGVVFRDIKLENVFIDRRGRLVIGDYSLAKILADHQRAKALSAVSSSTGSAPRTHCGTDPFMAPEVWLNNGRPDDQCRPYDTKVDCWSLGVLMYVLVTGHYPFVGDCRNDLQREVQEAAPLLHIDLIERFQGKKKTNCWNEALQASPGARSLFMDLIGRFLVKDPHCRCSVEESMEHPFWICDLTSTTTTFGVDASADLASPASPHQKFWQQIESGDVPCPSCCVEHLTTSSTSLRKTLPFLPPPPHAVIISRHVDNTQEPTGNFQDNIALYKNFTLQKPLPRSDAVRCRPIVAVADLGDCEPLTSPCCCLPPQEQRKTNRAKTQTTGGKKKVTTDDVIDFLCGCCW